MLSAEAHLLDETWRVQALAKTHRREGFDCSDQTLNEYLLRFVSQDSKRALTRAFVLVKGRGQTVQGYYTLSATNIQRERFPTEQAKKLPRYPIPAVLLGRLAINNNLQGQGLGEYLLIDALKRVRMASVTIGVHAVMVVALSDRAAQYYRNFGFIALAEQPRSLFLPMETIVQIP